MPPSSLGTAKSQQTVAGARPRRRPQDGPGQGPPASGPGTGGALLHSPSGLLTAALWQRELQRDGILLPEMLPDGQETAVERDRLFATWVQVEAKTLAGRLERLVRPGAKRGLAKHLRAVAGALAGDAEWARQRIDGREDDRP